MRTAAILPVKPFPSAKRRLAARLPDPARFALVQAMCEDVLDALAAVSGLERTVVVTANRTVALLAAERGAVVVGEPSDRPSAGTQLARDDDLDGCASAARRRPSSARRGLPACPDRPR
ncbi:MAG TPA: hypothetical protein VFF79_14765 [Conexibacter sp.]|nr:hypothetical protein [Conexibacter sp.]